MTRILVRLAVVMVMLAMLLALAVPAFAQGPSPGVVAKACFKSGGNADNSNKFDCPN